MWPKIEDVTIICNECGEIATQTMIFDEPKELKKLRAEVERLRKAYDLLERTSGIHMTERAKYAYQLETAVSLLRAVISSSDYDNIEKAQLWLDMNYPEDKS